MLKTKKKGFTIVELVIVIAVIAILAAVLIPTFAAVIKNAEHSSAMQACKSAYSEYLSDVASGKVENMKDIIFYYDSNNDGTAEYKFVCDEKGQFNGTAAGKDVNMSGTGAGTDTGKTYADGKVKVYK